MGADIKIENRVENSGEEYGDIIIKSSQLVNINIDKFIVPNIIDEIPILSVAGIFAEGKFQIKNAKELRIKESDRISALCSNFRSLGLTVNEYEDGFIIDGKILNSGVSYDSFNDHRIAMTFGILSSIIGDCEVKDFECVKISNPDFLAQLDSVSVK